MEDAEYKYRITIDIVTSIPPDDIIKSLEGIMDNWETFSPRPFTWIETKIFPQE